MVRDAGANANRFNRLVGVKFPDRCDVCGSFAMLWRRASAGRFTLGTSLTLTETALTIASALTAARTIALTSATRVGIAGLCGLITLRVLSTSAPLFAVLETILLVERGQFFRLEIGTEAH